MKEPRFKIDNSPEFIINAKKIEFVLDGRFFCCYFTDSEIIIKPKNPYQETKLIIKIEDFLKPLETAIKNIPVD